MPFNAIKFYEDYNIDWTDRGSKHCRPGWAQIHCPFCEGSRDYHLGFYLATGAYACWRCGKKSQREVIRALLNCSWQVAKELQTEYECKVAPRLQKQHEEKRTKQVRECVFPANTGPLTTEHRKYLYRRNFDPDMLEEVWGLKGTNHLGNYKFRIIAPIYFNGVMVSYQGRDITGKASLRYKACVKENELIDHQTILYGYDMICGDSCVVVEGITDVWRLGPGAVSCFGTAFTLAQVNLLAERCRKVFVLFDADDENAVKMAKELAVLLSARGVEVEILELEEGDPAEMSQEEANKLMGELGL